MLEVKGLKKTFKMSKKQQKIEKTKEKIKVAVADVSFDARPGEILGILGANGAGKTTTLRILASVIKADEGQVCLDGADITGNLMDYRRHIGFLTSELSLRITLHRIICLTTFQSCTVSGKNRQHSVKKSCLKNSVLINLQRLRLPICQPV